MKKILFQLGLINRYDTEKITYLRYDISFKKTTNCPYNRKETNMSVYIGCDVCKGCYFNVHTTHKTVYCAGRNLNLEDKTLEMEHNEKTGYNNWN